jgi:hypothetical protein
LISAKTEEAKFEHVFYSLFAVFEYGIFGRSPASGRRQEKDTPGSTVWSRRAHFMSAISASQARHPQFVSVQHLTSLLDGEPQPRKEPLPPLRLTRRGRIVLIGIPLILLAALLLSLVGFLNAPAKAADSSADLALTPTVSVTVQGGESLWGIAATVAPDRDPRDVIADIVQLNNLSAGTVVPGQQLFVPTK